jgi:hypothetical protein
VTADIVQNPGLEPSAGALHAGAMAGGAAFLWLDLVAQQGLARREDCERMLDLERQGQFATPAGKALFLRAMVDYLVWQERPTGIVTVGAAEWVLAAIGDQPTPAMIDLVFTTIREAEAVPEALLAAAMTPTFAQRRVRSATWHQRLLRL